MKTVYVRNSYLTKEWVPWESDIDFTIELKKTALNDEYGFLRRFWLFFSLFHVGFPFIKHIEIYNSNEIKLLRTNKNPEFTYLVCLMQDVCAQNKQPEVADYAQQALHFRLHDFFQFNRYLLDDKKTSYGYVRKYCKFFAKVSALLNSKVESQPLNALITKAQGNHYWLQTPLRFAVKGFFYCSSIFDALYNRNGVLELANHRRYTLVRLPKRCNESLPELNDVLTEIVCLCKQFADNVISVFYLTDPLSHYASKIRIIVSNKINEDNFCKLVFSLREVLVPRVRQLIDCAVLTENGLNYLISTQRLWRFEYFLLAENGRTVFGENCIGRLAQPCEDQVFEQTKNSLIPNRNHLRNYASFANRCELTLCFYEAITAWYALKENVVFVSRDDIDQYIRSEDCSLKRACGIFYEDCRNIESRQLYCISARILDTLIDEFYLNLSSNKG